MKSLTTSTTQTLRTLLTSFVVISLMGEQVAFAAGRDSASATNVPASSVRTSLPAPGSIRDLRSALPLAKSTKQAIVVIQLAEARPFGTYLEKGGTADEIKRLDADIKNLAVANDLVGIADHIKEFLTWWDLNKTSILLSQSKLKTAELRTSNLQAVFAQIFIVFKIEQTQAQKDPNQFVEWLWSKVTNPLVRFTSIAAFTIFIAFFSYSIGLVKGALVAGPIASVLGAFVEPFVRPIREKAAIVGARLFGKMGIQLNSKLFSEKAISENVGENLSGMSDKIKEAREEARKTRQLMNSMGYDLTQPQFAENMEKLHDIWNKTNAVWLATNPALFRDGRDVFSNAVALKPQAYAAQVMQSRQGAEQARQAIEQHIDRIISRTGKDAQTIESTVVSLLRTVIVDETAAESNKLAAQEAFAQAKEALKAVGASDYQVERIIESRKSELIYVRHTAQALATNVLHEHQYKEFNIALPDEVQKIQRTLRDANCLDYFQHEFRNEVAKIFAEMDLNLNVAEETVAAAKAAPELKILNGRRAQEKPKADNAGSKVRAKVERAMGALARMNDVRSNRVAVERVGKLGQAKAETLPERAAEAVKRVGKK